VNKIGRDRRGRSLFAVVAGVALASLLAACSASSAGGTSASAATGSSGSGGTITVGFDNSLTGSNAAFGRAELALTQGAVDYVNSTDGGKGPQIVLKSMDSGEIGSGEAAANTTQLHQDGAVAILGPTVSNDCVAVQPIVDADQIPDFCNFADSSQLESASSYIFEGDGFETGLVSPMVQFLKAQTGNASPKLAVLTNYSLGATDFGEKFNNVAKAEGVSIVYSGTMSQSATSVASYASQIAASKPDAVVAEVFPAFVKPLVQGLRGAGITVPIVTTIASADYPILASLKDPKVFTTEGASMLIPGQAGNTPQVTALLAGLAKAGLTTASQINADDGPTMLSTDLYVLETLKACGQSCTGAELVQQMEAKPFSLPGLVTNMQYTATNHSDHTTYQFWGWDPSTGAAADPGNKTYPAGSLSMTTP